MRFLTELQKSGDVVEACVKSGISAKEYQEQYAKNEQFRREVDTILTGHDLALDSKIARLGKQKFLDLLENGSTVHRSRKRIIYDEDNEVKQTDVTMETVSFPTPEWAIKAAIQKSSIEDALMVLAEESLIPRDKVRAILGAIVESKSHIRQLMGESSTSAEELSRAAITQAQADLLGISVDRLGV